MKVIVGLGNPGMQYARTRHNAGFLVLDRIAAQVGGVQWRRRQRGKMAEAGQGVLLVKPQTYMNLSGDCVLQVSRVRRIPASGFVIVLDDMDLEPGRIRVRSSGGSAGHKGMQSIIDRLGTSEIARVRVGIGHPPTGVDPVEWVLQRPFGEELECLKMGTGLAAEAALSVIRDGIELAMNRYNRTPTGLAGA
ncbi:MAG: aminoacyl-tRNA hydrolase [Bacillota bacterium]|nr:aminoacyl-tRNA hydrolase [Bacillota bacterium]